MLWRKPYDGSPHLHKYGELYTVLFLVAEFSFGKLFKTSVAIRSRDFTWKNDSAPKRLAQMDVTSFDASPTTWENLNVRTLSMPHRPGPDFLESQESTKTCSAPSTLAAGYKLDSSTPTASHHPSPRHQALHHHSTNSLHRYCIHKIPLCHGQSMQPQRSGYQVG